MLSGKGSNGAAMAAGMILSIAKMALIGANFEADPALVGLSLPL
jgi:hypothetical protein